MLRRLALTFVFVFVAASPAAANDGCTEAATPGCGGCACESCVCAMDAYCCDTAWDTICVDECQNSCGGCGGGGGDCDGVSYEGCCSSQIVMYCENGSLQQLDCTESPSCGWSTEGGFYDCGTAGTADPSGLHPISCSGGTSPVCGNGICESGETAALCPGDCGGGTCTPACADKQCGDDGCGGSCGTCPEPGFCDWEGNCESTCIKTCEGKECGPDGCDGQCGDCDGGEICDEVTGLCGEGPGECIPDCAGKQCGSDGCGDICGQCLDELACSVAGLCEPGEGPGGSVENPYTSECPPGQSLLYGKCLATGEDESNSGDEGCGTGPGATPLWALLFLLAVLRRRVSRVT